MGTLTSQAEICVWVQAPAPRKAFAVLRWERAGVAASRCKAAEASPRKNLQIVYAKSCNLVHFRRKMVRNAVHNAFFWSFRKTGTMGTLTSQAEIWCLGPSTEDASAGVRGYHRGKKIEHLCAKSCNLVHFGRKNGSHCLP